MGVTLVVADYSWSDWLSIIVRDTSQVFHHETVLLWILSCSTRVSSRWLRNKSRLDTLRKSKDETDLQFKTTISL